MFLVCISIDYLVWHLCFRISKYNTIFTLTTTNDFNGHSPLLSLVIPAPPLSLLKVPGIAFFTTDYKDEVQDTILYISCLDVIALPTSVLYCSNCVSLWNFGCREKVDECRTRSTGIFLTAPSFHARIGYSRVPTNPNKLELACLFDSIASLTVTNLQWLMCY